MYGTGLIFFSRGAFIMNPITFYSTNNKTELVNFETALINGLASHYGLYMISRNHIPQIAPESMKAMKGMPYARIAYEVLCPFLEGEVGKADLRSMLEDAYDDAVIPTRMQHVTGENAYYVADRRADVFFQGLCRPVFLDGR